MDVVAIVMGIALIALLGFIGFKVFSDYRDEEQELLDSAIERDSEDSGIRSHNPTVSEYIMGDGTWEGCKNPEDSARLANEKIASRCRSAARDPKTGRFIKRQSA